MQQIPETRPCLYHRMLVLFETQEATAKIVREECKLFTIGFHHQVAHGPCNTSAGNFMHQSRNSKSHSVVLGPSKMVSAKQSWLWSPFSESERCRPFHGNDHRASRNRPIACRVQDAPCLLMRSHSQQVCTSCIACRTFTM